MQISLKRKILLGRLLTRSGDQAWDFAVPLVLLQVLPNQLRYAALYYLVIKLATVFLLPSFTQLIDKIDRGPMSTGSLTLIKLYWRGINNGRHSIIATELSLTRI